MYWGEMNDWLSPPCSKYKSHQNQPNLVPCETFYTVEIPTTDVNGQNVTTNYKEHTFVGQKYQELRFVIIIGSVILIGLFNLCLYIYSARDIKKKTCLLYTSDAPDE